MAVTVYPSVAQATAEAHRAYWALPYGIPGSGTAGMGAMVGMAATSISPSSAKLGALSGTAVTDPGSGSARGTP